MVYIKRSVDIELDEFFGHLPAIVIDGAKGVGKTETASRRSSSILTLDTPEGMRAYHSDTSLHSFTHPILIDEWQKAPEVWNHVRHAVDNGAEASSYLLTGSASPTPSNDTHSGAGRIVSLRMRPMGLHERNLGENTISFIDMFNTDFSAHGHTTFALEDYIEHITSSGFPGIRTSPKRTRYRQLKSYIQLLIDKDLPEQGYAPRNPVHLHNWLRAYAGATATTTSVTSLSKAVAQDGTQPARKTTQLYREHLSRLWILDPLPGWIPAYNPLKRLAQAPKHYLADPALSALLLGVTEKSLLTVSGRNALGPLFEALAVLTLRILAQVHDATCYHLRTQNGIHEIDMIIELPDGTILPVEIKAKSMPDETDARHLMWLRERWNDTCAPGIIISTGQQAYTMKNGVSVVPLVMIGH